MTRETIVALHGFGGSRRSWDRVRDHLDAERYLLVAPDLRGHGDRATSRPVTLAATLEDLGADLREAAASAGSVTLAGYSLGGRVALHLALEAPSAVSRIVLISSTPGIEDPDERAARTTSDELLARTLEEEGLGCFAERWGQAPLWAGDSAQARAAQRDELRAGDPAGLAAALRGLGAGAVPAVWHRLATLAAPVTVVSGARDLRYGAIGRRVLELVPQPMGEVVLAGAGHGLLREAPAAVAAALV